jgi:hypothetical protein
MCWFRWKIERSRWRLIEAHRGGDKGLIRKRCLDGRQEIRSEARLHDIAESARVESGASVVRIFMDRQEDQAGRLIEVEELARRFDPVKPRHGDVENDNIWMKPLRFHEKLPSIADGTDHQTFVRQRVGGQREHRRMIVSE